MGVAISEDFRIPCFRSPGETPWLAEVASKTYGVVWPIAGDFISSNFASLAANASPVGAASRKYGVVLPAAGRTVRSKCARRRRCFLLQTKNKSRLRTRLRHAKGSTTARVTLERLLLVAVAGWDVEDGVPAVAVGVEAGAPGLLAPQVPLPKGMPERPLGPRSGGDGMGLGWRLSCCKALVPRNAGMRARERGTTARKRKVNQGRERRPRFH